MRDRGPNRERRVDGEDAAAAGVLQRGGPELRDYRGPGGIYGREGRRSRGREQGEEVKEGGGFFSGVFFVSEKLFKIPERRFRVPSFPFRLSITIRAFPGFRILKTLVEMERERDRGGKCKRRFLPLKLLLF